jgi:NAD(P)-dependent dehydrogenase (short-subunit alcohol dehydrogenase family)
MKTSASCQGDSCLHDKIPLVAGGAQGIGQATVDRFQLAGARVCIIDCDVESGEAAALEMTAGYQHWPLSFLSANLDKCSTNSTPAGFVSCTSYNEAD